MVAMLVAIAIAAVVVVNVSVSAACCSESLGLSDCQSVQQCDSKCLEGGGCSVLGPDSCVGMVGHLNVSCLNPELNVWHFKFCNENVTVQVVNDSVVTSQCGALLPLDHQETGSFRIRSTGKSPLKDQGWIVDTTIRSMAFSSQNLVIAELGTSDNGAVLWLHWVDSMCQLFFTRFLNGSKTDVAVSSLYFDCQWWTRLTLVARQDAVLFVNGTKNETVPGVWNQSLPLTSIGAFWSRQTLNASAPAIQQFQVFTMPTYLWSYFLDCDEISNHASCIQCKSKEDLRCGLPTVPPGTSTTYTTHVHPTSAASQPDHHSSGSGYPPSKPTTPSMTWTSWSPTSSIWQSVVSLIPTTSSQLTAVSSSESTGASTSNPTPSETVVEPPSTPSETVVEPPSTQSNVDEQNSENTTLYIGVGVGVGAAAVCLLLLVLGLMLYCVFIHRKSKKSFNPRRPDLEWGSHSEWRQGPTYAGLSLNTNSEGYLQPVPSVRVPLRNVQPSQLHPATDSDYAYAYASVGQHGGTGSIHVSRIAETLPSESRHSLVVENVYATVTKPKKNGGAISGPDESDDVGVTAEEGSDSGSERGALDHESAYSSAEESDPTHGPRYHVLDPEVEYGGTDQQEEQYWNPAKSEEKLYAQLGKEMFRKICRMNIELQEIVGSGEFGSVERAQWHGSDGCVQTVAVKTLKSTKQSDRVRFLQEAAIVGQFQHSNVVTLHGIVFPVSSSESCMIVLEYMPNGDLKNYLLGLRPDEPDEDTTFDLRKRFLTMMRDIAAGMEYLKNKSFVHRDLAARNVMLDQTLTCKISDFGLSRDLVDDYYVVQHGGKIPLRWTAPEAIKHRKYSSSSDIWSYGILIYEIWSLGERPYGSWSNQMVSSRLAEGYRLPPPALCPRSVYALMMDCWHMDHHSRPDFSAVIQRLSVEDSLLLQNSPNEPLLGKFGDPVEGGYVAYKDLQTMHQEM